MAAMPCARARAHVQLMRKRNSSSFSSTVSFFFCSTIYLDQMDGAKKACVLLSHTCQSCRVLHLCGHDTLFCLQTIIELENMQRVRARPQNALSIIVFRCIWLRSSSNNKSSLAQFRFGNTKSVSILTLITMKSGCAFWNWIRWNCGSGSRTWWCIVLTDWYGYGHYQQHHMQHAQHFMLNKNKMKKNNIQFSREFAWKVGFANQNWNFINGY